METEKNILLEQALAAFGLTGQQAVFIRHNENMTYQVGQYLLRIHKHARGFTTEPLYDGFDRMELYESELAFLRHLLARGLHVQQPVTDAQGRLVSRLPDGTAATMLTWLPGRTVEKEDMTPELCRAMGEMVFRLQRAARDFPPHSMLGYDVALCRRLAGKVERLRQKGSLSSADGELLLKLLQVIAETLRGEELLPVHCDHSRTNMLITPDGLVPIDFGLMGYGTPMTDLSSLLCQFSDPTHITKAVQGYRAAGGRVDVRRMDAGFGLNVLLGVVLHCESWIGEDWFAEAMERWRRNIFLPIVVGERVKNMEMIGEDLL